VAPSDAYGGRELISTGRTEMKHHGKHLLMCAPMIVVGVVLLALGAGLGVLIPVAGCILMMAAMMAAMPGHGGGGQ
jgi:hypothetical protein